MPRVLRHDRAHDYPHLIRRWRSVARSAGLVLEKYAEAGGHDLFYLRSRVAKKDAPAVYLSAGIHGDEAGATEGLLAWTQKNSVAARDLNLLIFPCLNPWGLVSNCRLDVDGRDLNRSYNNDAVAQIKPQLALFHDRVFDLSLMLHEDYDARGVYLYEVGEIKPYWGELLLKAAAKHIGPDLRRKIEGRGAKAGIVRRKISEVIMPDWPEAFILYYQKSRRIFTVETPSEFHLDDRVDAHVALTEKAVALCRKEFKSTHQAPAP